MVNRVRGSSSAHESTGSPYAETAWVAAGCAGLFCLLTFPLVVHPATTVLATNGDAFCDMLLFWYSRHWGILPAHVNTLFYPHGCSLATDKGEPLVRFLAFPLQQVMPLPLVFNTLELAFVMATGTAMYWLAKETGMGRGGAFLAAALLILSPPYLDEMSQGILESVSLQWLLLFILFAVRLHRVTDRLREGAGGTGLSDSRLILLGGTSLGLAVMTSLYQGVFAAFFLPLLPLRRIVLVMAVGAVLATPFVLRSASREEFARIRYDSRAAAKLVAGKMRQTDASFKVTSSGRFVRSFAPTVELLMDSLNISTLFDRNRPFGFRGTVPGVLVLALALLGAVRAGRKALPWAILTAIFCFLSLGPYLQWGSTMLARLPTSFLYTWFPHLMLPRPVRFLLAAVIPMALLAGFAVPRRQSSRVTAAVVCLLVAMQIFEIRVIDLGTFQISPVSTRVPAFYRKLAASSGKGALVELPLTPWSTQVGRNLYYQTVHHRPLFNYDFVRLRSVCALMQCARRDHLVRDILAIGPSSTTTVFKKDVLALRDEGFHYAVAHCIMPVQTLFPPSGLFPERDFDLFLAIYGEPENQGDGLLTFDLRHPRLEIFGDRDRCRIPAPSVTRLCAHVTLPAGSPTTLLAAFRTDEACASEVRALVNGGPGRLLLRSGQVDVASVRFTGGARPTSSWQWLRLRIPKTPGTNPTLRLYVEPSDPRAPLTVMDVRALTVLHVCAVSVSVVPPTPVGPRRFR